MTADSSDSIAGRLLARLPSSPDAYPQKIDLVGLTVLVIRWNRTAYRASSFLDDRILGPDVEGAWFPLDRVAEAARSAAESCPLHFIFHTGHVGSTLLSRLLDETGHVLSLREPLPLRTLAEAHDVLRRPDSLLSEAQYGEISTMLARLWSRGYPGTRAVVVKATSSAGRVAGPVLAGCHRSRAVYMNLRSEPYLATLLAGQNSPLDLRGHGPERIRRLQSFVAAAPALSELSMGELAAASWLVESWTQRDAVRRSAGRVLPLDFETLLASIEDTVRKVLRHFELPEDERYLGAIARSAVLTRYSKAPEHAYTPALRAEVLRDSRLRNRDEIHKGLKWLERMARSEDAVAQVLGG